MSTAQWLNIGDDPGALHALIERIPEHVPVTAIDYLWLFPARRIAIGESIVVVIGAFDEDPERRRVSTAHFTVSRNRKGAATVNARFDEHGSAPVSAVPRIVQGVLRRLGEDAEAEPREEQIDGEEARWDALIVELGGPPRTEPAAEDGEDAAPSDRSDDPAGATPPSADAPEALAPTDDAQPSAQTTDVTPPPAPSDASAAAPEPDRDA